LWHFATSLFLRWGVVNPTPNPQAWGPPLVGCLWLLIRYTRIHSYTPYLEAVSSIHNLRTRHAMVTRDPVNMNEELWADNVRDEISTYRKRRSNHYYNGWRKAIEGSMELQT
jgi:hypothetical protein